MLFYKLVQNKNRHVGTVDKWYAKAVYTDTVDLDELAEHMSNHNTPYSAGAIKGVLTDMVTCIKEIVLESKKVKIPDLAIFAAAITSSGADDRKSFTVQRNIRKIRLSARGTGEINGRTLMTDSSIREWK